MHPALLQGLQGSQAPRTEPHTASAPWGERNWLGVSRSPLPLPWISIAPGDTPDCRMHTGPQGVLRALCTLHRLLFPANLFISFSIFQTWGQGPGGSRMPKATQLYVGDRSQWMLALSLMHRGALVHGAGGLGPAGLASSSRMWPPSKGSKGVWEA